MADVYESAQPLVLLDLSAASEPIYRITELTALDFDQTLFLNGMLNFSNNRFTSAQMTAKFLQENLLKINQEYALFAAQLRKEKMKALAAIMKEFRDVNLHLTDTFVKHGLYNASGILQFDSIDGSDMSCAIARMDNRKWTQDFNPRPSYSTSETSLEYLGQILLSA